MNKGSKHTEESKAKISANHVSMLGRKHTARSRANMSAAHMGNKHTPEARAKISANHVGMTGMKHTPESRAKMSASGKGRKATSEARANMSTARRGRPGIKHTAEAKAKLSAAQTAYLRANPELLPARAYKRGWFFSTKMGRKIWYRSSYEKKAYEMLDASPIIKAFRAEPFTIPYLFGGVSRVYLPDLEVEFVGGEKRLVEIKPKALLSDEKNVAKFRAARAFAELNGYAQFNVWTERALF